MVRKKINTTPFNDLQAPVMDAGYEATIAIMFWYLRNKL
jgi:hypothetical protein